MAVGTGAISLQDVVNEIAGAQTSLQDCVDDHQAGGLDPTYGSTPVTSLAEFRGYADTCRTTTSLNFYATSSSGSSIGACSLGSGETTKYFAPAGGDVNNGDVVYNDAGGCTPFNGANQYYRVRANGAGTIFFTIRISSTGIVSSKFFC